jgi:hypothetical protein
MRTLVRSAYDGTFTQSSVVGRVGMRVPPRKHRSGNLRITRSATQIVRTRVEEPHDDREGST